MNYSDYFSKALHHHFWLQYRVQILTSRTVRPMQCNSDTRFNVTHPRRSATSTLDTPTSSAPQPSPLAVLT